MGEIVPRSQLTHHGVQGVGAIAGGIGLLVLSSLGGILGLIAGGALAVVGLSLTGSKRDRTAGIVTTAAGAITVVSALHVILPIFPNLGWMMTIPGIGLIGIGVYSLIKFIRGLKTRT